MLLDHVLLPADLSAEYQGAKLARKLIVRLDSVNFGHVTLEPELVADLLSANGALFSSMSVCNVSPQIGLRAIGFRALVTLVWRVLFMLGQDVFFEIDSLVYVSLTVRTLFFIALTRTPWFPQMVSLFMSF